MTDVSEFRARQKTVELDGLSYTKLKVAYTDVGEGEPIVLIHGIPTWSYLFHTVIPHLSQGARVISPDLLGYGYSDRRDCFDRSIRAQAKMVVALLDSLGIERATVLGHDIGGGAALVLAVDHPDRVNRLILTNIVAYNSWPNAGMIELGDPFWVNKPVDEVITFVRSRNFPDHDGPAIDAIFDPYMDEIGKVSLIRNASGLSTNHTMELVEQHRQIKPRTLLLWGTNDPWQEPWIAERLAEEIPSNKLVTVDTASHWIPLDEPQRFSEEILQFMRE